MRLVVLFVAGALGLVTIASFVTAGWDLPPVETEQIGYRGTGMVIHKDAEDEAARRAANVLPEPFEAPDGSGDRAGDVYENVQVLADLPQDKFDHLMLSITEWVSPEQGCEYCHNVENLASDEVYTKVVSRRMLQMTQAINADWQPHVQETGVTCYTCHRGEPVPADVWYKDLSPKAQPGIVGYRADQNVAAQFAGLTSLPQNSLEDYLLGDAPIRVHSQTALPTGENENGVMEAEHSWALMMHISESLGVNCVACHNSRAFDDWDQSPPQRVSAWHGIQMTRLLNTDYMLGMTSIFPDNRKGPHGDVFKVGCGTCHNGVQKPLYGQSMLADFVDSLGQKTETSVPDFSSYQPGATQVLSPQ